MVEEPAAVAAFQATALHAATVHELDAGMLALAARARARELWYAAPTHSYCKGVGISSWEGLWCRYEGDSAELSTLRAWAPTYRRRAWALALADQGVDDVDLASELGERFTRERRRLHQVFADAKPVLASLSGTYTLGVLTNGASCLQREKLAASGLREYFSEVVVSSDIGVTKPDATIFRHALAIAGADHAVMVGDSLERDIRGAQRAGLDAVWLNRDKRPAPDEFTPTTITTLSELPAALESGMLRRSAEAGNPPR